MNIIIPMAGMGKRMRPHTLTTPKPLIPIAGKPIVQRLVEDIAKVCGENIEEIGFVIGDFGKKVEEDLLEIAGSVGAKGRIFYQEEALGTAHAIMCAEPILNGNVVVAFADTLFKADFKLDVNKEGIIWVQKVENPSAFGVVKLNQNNVITDFIEKPQSFVSDLAIIGIYYFKDGDNLRNELKYLIDNNITVKGEFQLTDALENMKRKGVSFEPGEVTEWLDCGNKEATVNTNNRYLDYIRSQDLVSGSASIINSTLIPPVYIGPNCKVENCVLGPYVSVGENTSLKDSIIKRSIIQTNSLIEKSILENSIIGNFVSYQGHSKDLSVGDYNSISE